MIQHVDLKRNGSNRAVLHGETKRVGVLCSVSNNLFTVVYVCRTSVCLSARVFLYVCVELWSP